MNPVDSRRSAATQNFVEVAGALLVFLAAAVAMTSLAGTLAASPFGTAIAVALCGTLLNLRGERWRDVCLRSPPTWHQPALGGVMLAVLVLVFSAVAEPLLAQCFGPADVGALGEVQGNLPLFLYFLFVSWVLAGFCEEVLFRGFVMHRLTQIFGATAGSAWIAVVLQALIFGLLHFYQGTTGILLTAGIGLILGLSVMALDNLWPAIVAHGLVDTIGFADLYFGGTLF